MRHASVFVVPAVLAAASLVSSTAAAQSQGFAVDRFEPSERGSDWFVNESLDLRGHNRPAIGIVGDFAYQPLAIYNADGSVRTAIVEYQLNLHLGASYVLWDRVRFAFNLPIAVYEAGNAGNLNGVSYAAPGSANVGDLRLGADVRLAGQYGSAFTLAGGVQVWVPIGSRADYTGDGNIRLEPRFTAAGDIGIFTYAARLGFQYRGLSDSIGGVAFGSEVTYSAALGLRTSDHKLTFGPEIFGAATVTDSDQLFKARTTPLEALLGAHYNVSGPWRVGLGAGGGLTRGLGTPSSRVVAVLEWAPQYEEKKAPSDRDGDGIYDEDDACPDEKGIRTGDPKTNGCPEAAKPPPPSDKDGDGIIDDEDACPDVKGVKTDDPKTNGCPPPPPDKDGDGIIDSEDACPDVKGVKTDDPKTNGCPPDPDRDKDGIPNDDDACPDEPGPKNTDPKKNGCPAAIVKDNQIMIMEQVKFATGSAVILPASDTILKAVMSVLTAHPEIKKISVEGHTDNVGTPGGNKALSAARAASVVNWLVKHGVDKARLVSAGFGQEKPIDTNGTPEGRQNNRRVEFHIVNE